MNLSNPQNSADKGTQARILLVEDEPTNMAILAAYLRVAGYEVVEAADGVIAWDILSKDSNFDLLVTDRRMPNMDGLDLAKHVRSNPAISQIPVIMQTGATSQEEILEGIRAGVFYYLAKPYEEATLLGIVRSAIQERKQKSVFEQRMTRQSEALSAFVSGEMQISTPEEAQNTALLLSALYNDPQLVVTGLYELLLNAVEHGNLGIGYETKNRLLSDGLLHDEISKRLRLPENAAKRVSIKFVRQGKTIEITVEDSGEGFDWRPYMEIEPSRATHGSGRGIAKAALISFDRVVFEGKGNKVIAVAAAA